MKVGDIVIVRRTKKECFVEEVLTRNWHPEQVKTRGKGEKISLYTVEGEYVGDHWEDEISHTGRQIDERHLRKLISDAVKHHNWGLVGDFAKVWLIMGGKVKAT